MPDRLAEPAHAADDVDRAHVVFVASFDRDPDIEIDTERGSEERVLDIVHRQRVPGQQPVHPALAHQLAQIAAAAAVHDHRPGDHHDPTTGCFHLTHHLDDPRHPHLHTSLGGHVVGHEGEAEPVTLLELRRHPDSVHPANNQIATPHVPQRATHRAPLAHQYHRVHALPLDRDPPPAVVDLGAMVGCRVEIVRHEPVTGLFQSGFPLRPGMTPQRHQLLE